MLSKLPTTNAFIDEAIEAGGGVLVHWFGFLEWLTVEPKGDFEEWCCHHWVLDGEGEEGVL